MDSNLQDALCLAGVSFVAAAIVGGVVWVCVSPRARWTLAVWLGLALSACSPCAYYYDGNTAPGARPYYKACKDSDGKLRVRCDSPHRLPNADCE